MGRLPLSGVRVLDFSSLLPGPMATLLFAEAGASVVKVERPGVGDLGRARMLHGESIDFALLHRGKKSVALDLKKDADLAAAKSLALQADVLVDQFRPGVMDRLGLGYEELKKSNPGLIYCAITGYGQNGPLAQKASHDLNYVARSGILSTLVDEHDNTPLLTQVQIADIGGGTFPAIVNILLALLQRKQTGQGCYIDVAMSENTFFWMRRSLTSVLAGDSAAPANSLSHTGGTARYGIHLAKDGVALSIAPLEKQFWEKFCDIIGLSKEERDDSSDPLAVKQRVAAKLRERTGAEWVKLFEGQDACVEVVQGVDDALKDPHYTARGVFRRKLKLHSGREISALPVCLAPQFSVEESLGYCAIGDTAANDPDIWKR